MTDPHTSDDIVDRLLSLPIFASVPRAQIEWLVARGELRMYSTGALLAGNGSAFDEMMIVVSGRVDWYDERRGGWRKRGEADAGKIVGPIPYSRFDRAPGDLIIESDTTAFALHRSHFPGLIAECHELTAAVVHHMLDRSREIRATELNDDRVQSLGRIASGLAHELNNPASAAKRHTQALAAFLTDSEHAARDVAAARLSDKQLEIVDTLRTACARPPRTRTALEAADLEEDVSDWLMRHGVDPIVAEPLVACDVTIDALDRLAKAIPSDTLPTILRWVTSGSAAQRTAQEIAVSIGRIHDLIGAVKGFTFMDRDAVPEDVDVPKGIADTLSVLESKLRTSSVAVNLEAAGDLPHVHGFGSELNQVWQSLIDNAIDAAGTDGHVTITVTSRGDAVIVRVADNGPGIPEQNRPRVFDPFFTTKPVGKNTGLGLDLVRRIVHLHHGDVDFTSQPGRTVFRVRLPLSGARSVLAARPGSR